MFLSRLILNPPSRQERAEMANPYEMHRTVTQGFTGEVVETERVLYRLDIHQKSGLTSILVQSMLNPNWLFLLEPGKDYLLENGALPEFIQNPAVKEVNLSLSAGQMLAFRLRANPTRRLSQNHAQDSHKRVGLQKEPEQLQWLQRKMEIAGAKLISANVADSTQVNGKLFRENVKHTLKFVSAQFDGILQVQNPDQLIKSIDQGIGSGKGLGFGLLSIGPLNA